MPVENVRAFRILCPHIFFLATGLQATIFFGDWIASYDFLGCLNHRLSNNGVRVVLAKKDVNHIFFRYSRYYICKLQSTVLVGVSLHHEILDELVFILD